MNDKDSAAAETSVSVVYIKLDDDKMLIQTLRPGEEPVETIAQVVPPESHPRT